MKKQSIWKKIILFVAPVCILLVLLAASWFNNWLNGCNIYANISSPILYWNENEVFYPGKKLPGCASSAKARTYNIKTFKSKNLNASMKYARNDYTATKLNDGRVLVIGGTEEKYAEIYDPEKNKYKPIKTNYVWRRPVCILLNDGRVFVIAGNVAEIFDPKTETFKAVDTGKKDNGYFETKAVLLGDGKVFILNTFSKGDQQNNAKIFDPKTETFKGVGSAKCPLFGRTLVKLQDGRVLIMGGGMRNLNKNAYDKIQYMEFKDAEIFDPKTEAFSYTGNFSQYEDYYKLQAILLSNGKVLVLVSASNSGKEKVQLYNPKSGKFESVDEIPSDSCYRDMVDMGNNRVFISNDCEGSDGKMRNAIYKY